MSLPYPGQLPKPPRKAAPGARPAPAATPAAPAARPAAPAPRPAAPQAAAPMTRPGTPQRPPARPGAAPMPAARPHGGPAVATASRPAPAAAGGLQRPAGSAHPAAQAMPAIDLKAMPATVVPMLEAIRLYDELLCEENAALRAGDAKSVEALLDRKVAATRLYQERLRTLLSDQKNTKSLTPDQRAKVTAQVRCLEQRAHENTILLKANMNAIEQLFEVINTAARKMRHQDLAYSKAGLVEDGYMKNGVSLAYNNTI